MKAERNGLKLIPEAPGPLGRWNPLVTRLSQMSQAVLQWYGHPHSQNTSDIGIPFTY